MTTQDACHFAKGRSGRRSRVCRQIIRTGGDAVNSAPTCDVYKHMRCKWPRTAGDTGHEEQGALTSAPSQDRYDDVMVSVTGIAIPYIAFAGAWEWEPTARSWWLKDPIRVMHTGGMKLSGMLRPPYSQNTWTEASANRGIAGDVPRLATRLRACHAPSTNWDAPKQIRRLCRILLAECLGDFLFQVAGDTNAVIIE